MSLAAFIFCTVNCVYEYLRRGTAASPLHQHQQLGIADPLKLRLPTITFCNLNPIRSPLRCTAQLLTILSFCLSRDEMLVWLSVMLLHPKTPRSLTSFKSRLVLPYRYRLIQVILEKRPLNVCISSSSSSRPSSSFSFCTHKTFCACTVSYLVTEYDEFIF